MFSRHAEMVSYGRPQPGGTSVPVSLEIASWISSVESGLDSQP